MEPSLSVENHKREHREITVEHIFEVRSHIENRLEVGFDLSAEGNGRMLGILEHFGNVREDISQAGSCQCENQEYDGKTSGSGGEEQEGAQREHLALENKAHFLFLYRVMNADAGAVEEETHDQVRVTEHSSGKRKTAEYGQQLFLVVRGSEQHSRDKQQLYAHCVVAERHDVIRGVKKIERAAENA